MTTHASDEQFMLELINRARSDPLQAAQRYGIDLNDGLAPGTLSGETLQPVFANPYLIEAARAHSNWMLAIDGFSHQGQAGSSPLERMQDAGYPFAAEPVWGENLSWDGTTGPLPERLADSILEQHAHLFRSAEHRLNLLTADFREVGIGQATGQFEMNGLSYNSAMITQDFAVSDGEALLGGVVYEDRDWDDFYTSGEGLEAVTIRLPDLGLETQTSSAGGYQLAVPAGTHEVVFSGDALASPETRTVTIGDRNRKLDLVLEGDEPTWERDPGDYASRFIEALADTYAATQANGAAVSLKSALVEVFAGILSRQLTADSDQGGLQPNGAFDTLAPIFTFVATEASSPRPNSPMGYAPADLSAAHAAARVDNASSGALTAGGTGGRTSSNDELAWETRVAEAQDNVTDHPITPYEQFMLELVNRARRQPLEEASRYEISLNEELDSGTIVATTASDRPSAGPMSYGAARIGAAHTAAQEAVANDPDADDSVTAVSAEAFELAWEDTFAEHEAGADVLQEATPQSAEEGAMLAVLGTIENVTADWLMV